MVDELKQAVTPGESRADAVRPWLRLEGIAIGLLATLIFARTDHSWWLFALLFLAPDVSLLAYFAGPRVGGTIYNILHTYAAPALLMIVLALADRSVAVPLIWTAHIGFDRAFGYGLKYPTGFAHTHLGIIGRGRRAPD